MNIPAKYFDKNPNKSYFLGPPIAYQSITEGPYETEWVGWANLDGVFFCKESDYESQTNVNFVEGTKDLTPTEEISMMFSSSGELIFATQSAGNIDIRSVDQSFVMSLIASFEGTSPVLCDLSLISPTSPVHRSCFYMDIGGIYQRYGGSFSSSSFRTSSLSRTVKSLKHAGESSSTEGRLNLYGIYEDGDGFILNAQI